MTFADLFAALESSNALPPSRMKDCKTSLHYLATALGSPSLAACQLESALRDEAAWAPALDRHFAALTAQGRTISAGTRRNTRNNLRVVFRLAAERGLLTARLPVPLLAKTTRQALERHLGATSPYRTSYNPQGTPRFFGLPQADWPPDIAQGFQEWQIKVGASLRAATVRGYVKRMRTYLGYLANICGTTPAWETFFDLEPLAAYLRWQETRMQRPATHGAETIVRMLAAMANVFDHPNARALADFRRAQPLPDTVHTKRVHWVSLATLEAVAEDCLAEGRLPFIAYRATRHPGARRAARFQVGVILKLLVRIPLRQRNIRELRLDRNLFKDAAGHWQLYFRGSELKIGARRGQPNVYSVDLTSYCPDFLPVLEEFLTVHRPRRPQAASSPFCFLSSHGNSYGSGPLYTELRNAVLLRTGQRFYPHLIRSIWATEYLEATQDFTTAATMLGDTVQMVMKTYYDIIHKDHHTKAKAFLSTALHSR